MMSDEPESTPQPAFNIVPQGYAQAEVDAYLREVMQRVHNQRPQIEEASEALRSILLGAEQSARALREAAEREAAELRDGAQEYARVTREEAAREARAHVVTAQSVLGQLNGRVETLASGVHVAQDALQAAADAAADRIEAIGSSFVADLRRLVAELGAEADLIGRGLATSGPATSAARNGRGSHVPELPAKEKTMSDLDAAEAALDELTRTDPPLGGTDGAATTTGLHLDALVRTSRRSEEARRERGPEPEREPEPRDEPPAPEDAATPSVDGSPVPPAAEPSSAVAPTTEAHGQPPVRKTRAGVERARLAALNMALNGTPREETARQLAQAYGIEDAEAILDEVYAKKERIG